MALVRHLDIGRVRFHIYSIRPIVASRDHHLLITATSEFPPAALHPLFALLRARLRLGRDAVRHPGDRLRLQRHLQLPGAAAGPLSRGQLAAADRGAAGEGAAGLLHRRHQLVPPGLLDEGLHRQVSLSNG